MIWPSVEHVSNNSLVAEQFKQIFLLLILSHAFWITKEVIDQGKYLIVSNFRFSYSNRGLGHGVRRIWLSDIFKGFILRSWFCFYLSYRIRNFSLRYKIKILNLRNGILRLYVSCRILNFSLRFQFFYLILIFILNFFQFLISFFLESFKRCLKFKVLSSQFIYDFL